MGCGRAEGGVYLALVVLVVPIAQEGIPKWGWSQRSVGNPFSRTQGRQQETFSFSPLCPPISLFFPCLFIVVSFQREQWIPPIVEWMAEQTPTHHLHPHFLCQKGHADQLLDLPLPAPPPLLSAASSSIQSTPFQVHRWRNLWGILVCCAEVLFFFSLLWMFD